MSDVFDFSATPPLHFGAGKIALLEKIAKGFGSRILLVRGGKSFDHNPHLAALPSALRASGFMCETVVIDREPSPQMIDEAVATQSRHSPDVVVAIGGGSVLDAGKAISAMIPINDPVRLYLEGVGTKQHPGTKLPFIAIPTTSGTGSEATKNAVLSEVGANGYKRSLRHNRFIPDVAIIDPALIVSCPQHVTAASGMDAFTQLLESFVSTAANPVTDALALKGLELVGRSLIKTFHHPRDVSARSDMALAAYLSGVVLANAGLGLVHGFASSIGGRYDIPHGVICSALMSAANEVTVRSLKEKKDRDSLIKFALAGKALGASSEQDAVMFLLEFIRRSAEEMRIPKLATFGLDVSCVSDIASQTDNKNNPVKLPTSEVAEVLRASL